MRRGSGTASTLWPLKLWVMLRLCDGWMGLINDRYSNTNGSPNAKITEVMIMRDKKRG